MPLTGMMVVVVVGMNVRRHGAMGRMVPVQACYNVTLALVQRQSGLFGFAEARPGFAKTSGSGHGPANGRTETP
jgi:hypothetical protein